jgi:hypothetical protein
MAQRQIDQTRRAPSLVRLVAAFVAAIRDRGRQRRALVRLLSQLDTGLATGARV